jgi:hypothetical protein
MLDEDCSNLFLEQLKKVSKSEFKTPIFLKQYIRNYYIFFPGDKI